MLDFHNKTIRISVMALYDHNKCDRTGTMSSIPQDMERYPVGVVERQRRRRVYENDGSHIFGQW
jgi:hypothetical protein